MKIVLDTNVFVSGIFFKGPPHQILRAWRDGKVQLVISPEILDEYNRVGGALSEKYPAIDIRPIIELVTVKSEMVSPAETTVPICDDPDDDKFFLGAISARCKLNHPENDCPGMPQMARDYFY